VAGLTSKSQILAAYQGKRSYPEEGAECFLEVLVDIRDLLNRITTVLETSTSGDGVNIGVRVQR
jgi:hypothetical protein